MILKCYPIYANDYDHAGIASSELKKWVKDQGYSSEFVRRFAIACYEAEINLIIHSLGGEVCLELDEEWIHLIFQDKGPGIENIELAMKAGWSSANTQAQAMGFGAGLGLPNIKRNADCFKLESCCEGTKLTIGFKITGEKHEHPGTD